MGGGGRDGHTQEVSGDEVEGEGVVTRWRVREWTMGVDERYCTMYHSICNEVRLHSPPSELTEATSSSSRNITLLVCSITALEGGQEEGGGWRGR